MTNQNNTQNSDIHFDEHLSWGIEKLMELCKIPSVSFPNYDPAFVLKSAQATAQVLQEAGFEKVQVVQGDYAPAVIAAWGNHPNKPTVLLYAHHDVQPEMDLQKWISAPFEPTIRNGRLFARGAADDKAGILVHAVAAMSLTEAERPNLRVVIEGEEEVGSPSLLKLLQDHKEFLQCDTAIIADLGNFDTGIPAITTSLRGMVALEVEVTALARTVHSGMWSGPIPDPVQALCKMVASLTDAQGQICVPGLLEQVIPPDSRTLESYQSLDMQADKFRKDAGMLYGELLCHPSEIAQTLWRKPSLTVTTFEAGNRKAAGNVLLAQAYARISIRLVPGLHWQSVVDSVSAFLRTQCPWGLSVSITPDDGANAWSCNTDHPYFLAMSEALKNGYGTEAKIIGCGASIPGAPLFTQVFGDIPILLTGLEDHHSNAHGENESLDLKDFAKAILSEREFFRKLSHK